MKILIELNKLNKIPLLIATAWYLYFQIYMLFIVGDRLESTSLITWGDVFMVPFICATLPLVLGFLIRKASTKNSK